ncbi:MAG: adenylyl-sulfate kinase [Alphaproteobacteria bacterium]|nr:adenylyl-sulfate kinase [Alphaproteobacteria bacterium]
MTQLSPLKIVVVGHVDHGKSTLVGRLLNDTGSLPAGKLEAVKAASEKRGVAFEWAFLLDALQAERDQGITIDTTQIRLKTKPRETIIIDAPGHREFLKNMITGAASADAAILVVDAVEGLQEQTRRHGYLLHLLGLRQVVVAVNKMDAVNYDIGRFAEVVAEVNAYLSGIGIEPQHIIPISAYNGANVVTRIEALDWFTGPTLIDGLTGFKAQAQPVELPLRFPVQDVLKLDDRRIVVGRIESGRLRVGDEIVFNPSGKSARIASIESWGTKVPVIAAVAGQSVGITLDDHIFIERGQIGSHQLAAPREARAFRANLFWLGTQALEVGQRYKLRLATSEQTVEVERIVKVVDLDDLKSDSVTRVDRHAVAEVVLRSKVALALDEFSENSRLGRFVLVDGFDIVGGGIVVGADAELSRLAQSVKSRNLFPVGHRASLEARWLLNGHKGGVIWLTGLSGAGKSTVAMEVEHQLLRKGRQVYVLDGDNLRQGLNSDLGFSPEDRTENIRRVGEVAHLFASAGTIVITAFISPYQADRDRVRTIQPETFHEVYVKAGVGECTKRDPKGLYAKAIKGEIPEFTGISAPYEAPEAPELVVETEGHSVESSVAQLLDYIDRTFALDAGETADALRG